MTIVVIGNLQEYLGPRLGHPEAVWVLDGKRLPQAGQEVSGSGPAVLRDGQGGQLPGSIGPSACRMDKRLYLPENWTSDTDR